MYRFFKAVNVFHIYDAVHEALTPFYLGWIVGAVNPAPIIDGGNSP